MESSPTVRVASIEVSPRCLSFSRIVLDIRNFDAWSAWEFSHRSPFPKTYFLFENNSLPLDSGTEPSCLDWHSILIAGQLISRGQGTIASESSVLYNCSLASVYIPCFTTTHPLGFDNERFKRSGKVKLASRPTRLVTWVLESIVEVGYAFPRAR